MDSALTPEAKKRIKKIGQADILIGIPSFNNGDTIGYVLDTVHYGLVKYFPKYKSVIINSDGGSTDNTKKIIESVDTYEDLDKIIIDPIHHPAIQPGYEYPVSDIYSIYVGIPGKGSALRAIFEIAQILDARACATVDSDLRSITPEWIQLLVGPILYKGYDYITSDYFRHKCDGTITNLIIYPLVRALYGKRIRQPIGGDIGFSPALASFCLEKDVWNTDVARFGIDIWVTNTALCEGFRIAQSFLGTKIHNVKDPSTTLGLMFRQVIGTTFSQMAKYKKNWIDIKGSTDVLTFGYKTKVAPEEIQISASPLIEKFKQGLREYGAYWKNFLIKENMDLLSLIAKNKKKQFTFPDDVWVKIIYDFAIAYCSKNNFGLKKEELIDSLAYIYFGKMASFTFEVADLSSLQSETQIEKLACEFEKLKPYLIKRWREK